MAVVEVLESHMDSMVVQHMKHSSSLWRAGAIGAEHAAVELGPYDPQGAGQLRAPNAGCREIFISALVQQTIYILWLVTMARKKKKTLK